MDLDYYKFQKKELQKFGVITVSKRILNYKISENAIRKLTIAINANQRQGSAYVKKRGEVSGGGRKPWRQKGTGNARQGSIRAPQWRGGGNVFGPTGNENFTHKVNKKERKLAVNSAWCKKILAGKVLVVEKVEVTNPRVADAIKLLTDINTSGEKILIVGEKIDKNLYLATRNVINISYFSIQNLSVNIILKKHLIVISKKAFSYLEKRF